MKAGAHQDQQCLDSFSVRENELYLERNSISMCLLACHR